MAKMKLYSMEPHLSPNLTTEIPAVSVVLPTYNRGYCLRRAVDSVLAQTFANFELIVIDDGSTDDTVQVIQSYDDPRIIYVQNESNRGQPTRLNDGIRLARADLIAFQDSDDEWMPTKLARQVEAMRSLPPDVGMVYTDKWRCEPDRDKFHWKSPTTMPEDGIIFDQALDDRVYNIGPQSVLIRRTCFDKVGLFDENLYNFNDWDMFVRISRHFLFSHIPEPLVNYNVSADAMTATGEGRGIEAIETLFQKYLPDLEKNRPLLARRAYWIGSFHMRDGDAAKGRAYLRRAFRAQPFNPRYVVAAVGSFLTQGAYQRLYRSIKPFSKVETSFDGSEN